MKNEQLRQHVTAATATAWPAFAAEHPALARVIDEATLNEYVSKSLADDPAFVEAYHNAVEANVAATALANLLSGFVAPVLRRLL